MIELSLVVPSYRKDKVIIQDINAKIRVLRALNITFELILVIDGDCSETLDKISSLEIPELKVFHYEPNHGKGYAVKYGLSKSQGKYAGYLDADLDINPIIIKTMYDQIRTNNFDIVYADRTNRDSICERTFLRKLFSFCLSLLGKILLDLPVKDTQTGAKMYTKKVIDKIIPLLQVNGMAFETEFFILAGKHNFNHTIGVPVQINKNNLSTINFRIGIDFIIDTLKNYIRLRNI